jgi:error-prone DNA polymerase
MSLNHHPVGLLRDSLSVMGAVPARELRERPNNQRLTTAGLILVRQRPGTANGVIFLTLEDETGVANVIIWPNVFERFRKVVLSSRLVKIRGKLQREGLVTHLIAEEIVDLSARLDALGDGGDDGSTDEIKYGTRPGPCQEPAGETKLAKPSLWRHPRNTHIAIKSRNFH